MSSSRPIASLVVALPALATLGGCEQVLGDFSLGLEDAGGPDATTPDGSAADANGDAGAPDASDVDGDGAARSDAADGGPARDASGDAPPVEGGVGPAGDAGGPDAACPATFCSRPGPTCQDPHTLVTCTLDGQGCAVSLPSTTVPCANGACSGDPGSASCCTNACTPGSACASSRSVQTCAVGDAGCTAMTGPVTCSSGFVCESLAPAGCADPSWAEWPIGNSASDVALGAPNLESYTDHGDGTVTDGVTGLTWQQTASATTYTWNGAATVCPMLTLAGHTDWRLPSAIELVSLLNYDQPNLINPVAFPTAPPSTTFWSSTQVVPIATSSTSWAVGDSVAKANTGNLNSVRCVR